MRLFTKIIYAFTLLMGLHLAANAQIIQFTSPTAGQVIYQNSSVFVSWTGTDTVSCLRVLPTHAGTIQQGSPKAAFFSSNA
jgi:hypothetical protein